MDDVELTERVTKAEVKITGLQSYVTEMRTDIKEIKDKLLGRPSWVISLIITILVAIVVGLIRFK